jgi:hypothetical protein
MTKRQPSLLYGLMCLFILNAYLADLTGVDVIAWLGI